MSSIFVTPLSTISVSVSVPNTGSIFPSSPPTPPAPTPVPPAPPPGTLPTIPPTTSSSGNTDMAGNGIATGQPPGNNFLIVSTISPVTAFRAVAMAPGGIQHASNLDFEQATFVLGIVDNSYVGGTPALVYTGGNITNPISGVGGWAWTINQYVYLGENGELTQTVPTSGLVRIIGFAISSNTIEIIQRPQLNQIKTIPWSNNITVSLEQSNTIEVLLTDSPTVVNFTNGHDGETIEVILRQDSFGNRVVNFGSMCSFSGGIAPQNTLLAGKIDIFKFKYLASINKYLLTDFDLNY